jgi:DNA-binding transcriptional MerR regulator
MSQLDQELYPGEVAQIAGCSPSTVKRYEKRGVITAVRDHNGFRRYRLSEALKLKELLSIRTHELRSEGKGKK